MSIHPVGRSQLGVAQRSQLGVLSRGGPDTIRLYSETGVERWRRYQYTGSKAPNNFPTTYAVEVSGELVLGGSVNGVDNKNAIVAWNGSGTKQWSYDVTSGVVTDIQTLANGNFVYTDVNNLFVHCLDRDDGSLLWTNTDTSGNTPYQRIAVSGNNVGVVNVFGDFWAIDGTTGVTSYNEAGLPGANYRGITAGGLGVWTVFYFDSSPTKTIVDGLNLDGTANGVSFEIAGINTHRRIRESPSGNLLMVHVAGDIEERNSSGTVLQSDTTTFTTAVTIKEDAAGNLYAWGYRSATTASIVKYDGSNLSSVLWEQPVDRLPVISVASANVTSMALYSPSSEPSPVVGFRHPL